MADGRAGVDRVIEILGSEIARTMQLLGVASLDEMPPAWNRSVDAGRPVHASALITARDPRP